MFILSAHWTPRKSSQASPSIRNRSAGVGDALSSSVVGAVTTPALAKTAGAVKGSDLFVERYLSSDQIVPLIR